MKSIFAKF